MKTIWIPKYTEDSNSEERKQEVKEIERAIFEAQVALLNLQEQKVTALKRILKSLRNMYTLNKNSQ